ncbi:MAG: HPr family phosphocarrier protein [Candidatus Omnitrophota bacterium]
MKPITKKLIVRSEQGLHARPAALFVQAAGRFDCKITVSKDGQSVNGKSIMGILMLGAAKGTEISIQALGDDAACAIEELEKIV